MIRARTVTIEEGEPAERPLIVWQDDKAIVFPAEPRARRLSELAWQRVESYIAHRWGIRAAGFTVEGPGHWQPPLRPFTPTTIEVWSDGVWVTTTDVAPSPFGGLCLRACGPYRFVGNLGSTDEPPRVVREAAFRLFRYFEGIDSVPDDQLGVARFKTNREPYDAFQEEREIEREMTTQFIARALQQSGAADLLRPFRNLGAA